jgi:hypothetical protein
MYLYFNLTLKIVSNSSKLLSCPQSDNQANIDYCFAGGKVECCNKNSQVCKYNKLLTAASGTITSPGYPDKYPHNAAYNWRITVPEGFVVQLNFTKLITYHLWSCSNSRSNCTCDYAAALDGPCGYNLGTTWCGGWSSKHLYPSFISTGRQMYVMFKSDSSYNHVGFVANYRMGR